MMKPEPMDLDDLITRLRKGCSNHPFCGGCQDERSDAADEIEWLRAALLAVGLRSGLPDAAEYCREIACAALDRAPSAGETEGEEG